MNTLLLELRHPDLDTILLLILIILITFLLFQLRKSSTTSTPLQILNQSVQDIRVETARLTEQFQARTDIEKQIAGSIKRLETIMAGSGSIGMAGQHVIEEFLAKLPSEWQTRNFRVGNKTVEFGLRLPNNLILPIDSKWTASRLLEQFDGASGLDEQKRLKAQIEREVINRAREVQKYIDPNITTSFGIAVVPDAVYNLCPSINVRTLEHNIVVVSYSLLLPYLLVVFQIMLTTAQTLEIAKASVHLRTIEKSIEALQSEIEGRLSDALTRLHNSKGELQTQLGKANSALANIRSINISVATNPYKGEAESFSEGTQNQQAMDEASQEESSI